MRLSAIKGLPKGTDPCMAGIDSEISCSSLVNKPTIGEAQVIRKAQNQEGDQGC